MQEEGTWSKTVFACLFALVHSQLCGKLNVVLPTNVTEMKYWCIGSRSYCTRGSECQLHPEPDSKGTSQYHWCFPHTALSA